MEKLRRYSRERLCGADVAGVWLLHVASRVPAASGTPRHCALNPFSLPFRPGELACFFLHKALDA